MPHIRPDDRDRFPATAPARKPIPTPELPKAPPPLEPHKIPKSARSPFISRLSINKFSVPPAVVFQQMFPAPQ